MEYNLRQGLQEQMWNVCISKATSTIAMLHHKKPAFTDGECEHLESEVGQCRAKLAKALTNKFYLVGIIWVTLPMV